MTTRTVRGRFKINGVLTTPTSAKLSDATGTYGVKRDDTSAVVVADGTDMTLVSTGVYEYEFTEPAGYDGPYTAWVEFVYDGNTYRGEVEVAEVVESVAAFEYGWDELRVEIADFLGWQRDSTKWTGNETSRLAAIIKSGLLHVYYPEQVKADLVHQWSWMRPEATIETTAAYATGTIEVVDGVVTLTGGTWPTWAAEGELTVGSETYSVDSRDSGVQVTLDDTTVDAAAGSSYSLGRPTYDLPAGFDGAFDGDLCYKPGSGAMWTWPSIRIVSDLMLRRQRQFDTSADRPLFAAIRPGEFDPTTGQRWQITLYPAPNAVYTLHGRYKVRPTMIDAANKYPMGGVGMAEVFLESCLAVAEQRFRDEPMGGHTQRFLTLLAAAIANDADAFSPEFLGYNGDGSSGCGRNCQDSQGRGAIHSYNGTVYYDHNP